MKVVDTYPVWTSQSIREGLNKRKKLGVFVQIFDRPTNRFGLLVFVTFSSGIE
jgi:hypothetical protein